MVKGNEWGTIPRDSGLPIVNQTRKFWATRWQTNNKKFAEIKKDVGVKEGWQTRMIASSPDRQDICSNFHLTLYGNDQEQNCYFSLAVD